MTDILTLFEGTVLRVRLNRPKALHALNTAMCGAMLDALVAAEADQTIEIVMLDHAEGRGFCAGGDIRMLAESGAGDGSAAREFFRIEYQLNHRLFTFAKPTVAFMDGITMGGGVGIACPCDFRVATENTRFAMPETGIGLFPDVGGGWYLSRLPGRIGQYLALTGHRLNGAECKALGLATHYLSSSALEATKDAIAAAPRDLEAVLAQFAETPPDAPILVHREAIDRLFASDTLEDIVAALGADGGAWAAQQIETLHTRSPQSLKVSLRLLRDGRAMASFADEMRQEYAVGSHVVQSGDFVEGVRAVIVDKDNAPEWRPSTFQAVTDDVIDRIFAALPANEEWNPA